MAILLNGRPKRITGPRLCVRSLVCRPGRAQAGATDENRQAKPGAQGRQTAEAVAFLWRKALMRKGRVPSPGEPRPSPYKTTPCH